MSLLDNMARLYRGKVRGDKACLRWLVPGKRPRWKDNRYTVTAYVNRGRRGGEFIGVNCHHPDLDPKEVKETIERDLGISWQPRRSEWKPTPPSFRILQGGKRRANYLIDAGQALTEAQLDLLVNDYRLAGHSDKEKVRGYVAPLGKSDADFERAWAKGPRVYRKAERDAIWGLGNMFRKITVDAQSARKREATKAGQRKASWLHYTKWRRWRLERTMEVVRAKRAVKVFGDDKSQSLKSAYRVSSTDSVSDVVSSESLNQPQNYPRKRRKPPKTTPEPPRYPSRSVWRS